MMYARLLLRETREELNRADGKASILLAAAGVVVGALLAAAFAGRWHPLHLEPQARALSVLAMMAAAYAVGRLGLAVWPSIVHPKDGALLFWGHALSESGDSRGEHLDHLRAQIMKEARDPLARAVDQLHVVGTIVDRKYGHIRHALVALGMAATLAGLASIAQVTTVR